MSILQLVFRILILCMLVPYSLFAQEVGERFWSGLVTYAAKTDNSFRVSSNGNFNNRGTTTYFLESRINYGKFISNNRAISLGLIGSINYSESDYYKVANGDNRNNINYRLGGQIGLTKLYEITPKFYAIVNHDFGYIYGWNGSNDTSYNKVNTHTIAYRLSPGLLYRMSARFSLQVNLALLNVGVSRTLYTYSKSSQQIQTIDLNILSGTTLNNISFGVLYFPFQSQHTKRK